MLKDTALEVGPRTEKKEITGSADKSNSTTIPLLNVVFFLLIRGAWLITVQSFELEIVF